jgi:hypothetical protein
MLQLSIEFRSWVTAQPIGRLATRYTPAMRNTRTSSANVHGAT